MDDSVDYVNHDGHEGTMDFLWVARETDLTVELGRMQMDEPGVAGFFEEGGDTLRDADDLSAVIENRALVSHIESAMIRLAGGGSLAGPLLGRRQEAPGGEKVLGGELEEEVVVFGGDAGVVKDDKRAWGRHGMVHAKA